MMIPCYVITSLVGTPNAPLPVILSTMLLTARLAMTLRTAIASVPLGEVLLCRQSLKLRDVLHLARERAWSAQRAVAAIGERHGDQLKLRSQR